MTGVLSGENPFAGQGSVLLDIGGDVGALIVVMPEGMAGEEVEIAPSSGTRGHRAPGLVHRGHEHAGHHHHAGHHPHAGEHLAHVAVVNRPVAGTQVPSLVFPELVEGRYDLFPKGTRDVRVTVEIRGGEVTTAGWPR